MKKAIIEKQSVRSDDYANATEYYKSILVHYLTLENNQYVLNASEETLSKIGVPCEVLSQINEELAKTNEIIITKKADPNCELLLTDPKDLRAAPNGTLTTSGQGEVISPFIGAPYGIRGIRFHCRGNAAITPIFTCMTYSSDLWQSRTAIGLIGTITPVEVPLYVSNDYIRVSFSTTDSNGGSATYEGY